MARKELWANVPTARLITGLVLFAYVATHLLNHAVGLFSLGAAESVRHWFLWLWRNPIGTPVLYASVAVHFSLALWSVYRRRTLRMPVWEAAQMLLGLCIPPLLIEHVIGTRGLHEIAGLQDSYTYVSLVLWVWLPEKAAQQIAALVVAWLHGCIGLHFWLRLKPWYRRAVPVLYAGALVLPLLAVGGFANMGREAAVLARDPSWLDAAKTAIGFPGKDIVAEAGAARDALLYVFVALLAATFALRALRLWVERRRGIVRVSYSGNRQVEIAPGMTLLEASRMAGIPHASVCGGRGRCSTCRVRVSAGLDRQPPASDAERKVLDRVGAPPNVRLACQLRPGFDLTVVPLLPTDASPRAAKARPAHLAGEEKEIAILFADLRGFTKLSEGRLPYDVVFVLNRYFEAMGRAIEESGGTLDKFIGDGVMALFGIERGTAAGCREALAAARAMAERLAELNRSLGSDLEAPLRIGIVIHVGAAIVGEMGYARAVSVTAVGDAVNTASRLEGLTKEYGAELVVSEGVAEAAGIDLDAHDRHRVEIRGRSEPLHIRVIVEAISLPKGPAH